VISLKSWIGHLAAACGAVETAIALFCMRGGFIPAIRNLEKPCHAGINLIAKSIETEADSAMVQSFGFGGQNSALVIRKWKN
jgi:3-oxoacyl-[acyl-carrier-protein] synthase II